MYSNVWWYCELMLQSYSTIECVFNGEGRSIDIEWLPCIQSVGRWWFQNEQLILIIVTLLKKSHFNSSLILLLLLLFVAAVLFLPRKRYKMFHHLFLAFPPRLFFLLSNFCSLPLSLFMMWMICMRCEFNYKRNEWMSAKEWMDDTRICFMLLTGKIELKRMLGRSSCLWQWRMLAPRNQKQEEEMVISWQTSLSLDR